ncbi:MAG: CoA ester lyase [Actinobacteria bacterium]|nr:MAG: CoA ester lyase [Actinomycetota bacterium]
MTDSRVPRLRSALFVPAHREDFREKACTSGADALILDLEDSVPPAERDQARAALAHWFAAVGPTPAICVRINALADDCLDADLDAAVRPGVLAVMVPKVASADAVRRVADAVTERERRARIAEHSVRLWPSLEDAPAIRDAYALAGASDRIAYMGCAAARNGDLAHSLGFEWTNSFLETLYVRSKVLVDMRAARIPNPMTGVVTNIDDLDEVEAFARQSRAIGYEGMMVIHPSHVPIVNSVFGASSDDVAAARRLLEAWDDATRAGVGALNHDGHMVDAAMIRVAQDVAARGTDKRP